MQHSRAIPQFRAFAQSIRIPRKLRIDEWVERNVILPPCYSQPGSVSLQTSRYLIDPLLCCADPTVREETIIKAIKMGGSMIAEFSVAHSIVNTPGNIMWTMQSDDDAKEHMKGRGWALLKSVKGVRDMLPIGRRHDITDTTVYFGDSSMWVNGANRNNAQAKDIRSLYCSEVWLWKQGLHGQFKGRVSAFERMGTSKIVNESQASVAGHDLEAAWLATDQGVWSVACEHCGVIRPLEFFGRMDDDPETRACVVWDKEADRPDGGFDEERLRKSTRYRCAKCGKESPDSPVTRVKWNDSGRYLKTRHDAPPSKRGHRFNALAGHELADLAAQFRHSVEAKKRGQIGLMRDFYMQKLALFWREDEQREKITLKTAGYTLADVAKNPSAKITNEATRLLVCDVQRDHFWCIVLAFRADGTCRLLYRSKVLTAESIEEIRQRYEVAPRLTFLDAQHATGKVYDLCAKHDYTALHGSGKDSFTWGEGKRKEQRLYSATGSAAAPHGGLARYIFWASDPIKDILHSALSRGVEIELPDDADDEDVEKPFKFSTQLQGDHKKEVLNKTTGRNWWRWVKRWENHYWDCFAMAYAVADMLRLIKTVAPAKVDTEPPLNGGDSTH